MKQFRAINVAALPKTALGSRGPTWWGNTLFMVVETTTVMLLLVSYFYLWRNFEIWPPPQRNLPSTAQRPLPGLAFSTINTMLMLVIVMYTYFAEQEALQKKNTKLLAALLAILLLGLGSILLRFVEFQFLGCRWDENAYGSIVWAIMVVHLTYLIASILEMAVLTLWLWMYGLDDKQVVDVTLAAAYWYWTVAVWLVLYVVIYWTPRLL